MDYANDSKLNGKYFLLIVLLIIVITSSYLYFFHFESFIGYVARVPAASLAKNSPNFLTAWRKVIPYKLPLLFFEVAISLLLVIYVFVASLKSSFFVNTVKVFSILLFVFYLLMVCLASITPYGMLG